MYQALAVLTGFVRDGSFPKLYSLEVQELEFQPLQCFVEVRDLFLRQYNLLRLKYLHKARVEPEGAIVDSLHIVRCHS